jgi:hypothetical protein
MKSIYKIAANIPKVLQYRAYPSYLGHRVENDLKWVNSGSKIQNINDIYSLESYLKVSIGLSFEEAVNVVFDAVQIYLNELDK